MRTISKDRTYTCNGCPARIYDTEAGDDFPIHGAVEFLKGDWFPRAWTKEGRHYSNGLPHASDLTEAIKPNGIPVDLPDPPEVDGYRWEARGWGWKSDEERAWNSINIEYKMWITIDPESHVQKLPIQGYENLFYIEYLPIAEEMTLDAAISEALGRNIKIKQ